MREGWTYKKLGEVITLYDSQRKPVTKKDRKGGVYPYYGASGIQDYVDRYIFDGRFLLVGEDGAKWGANERTTFIAEGKIWVNNHAHIMTFDTSVNDRFVEYYLNGKDLNEYITGAVVPKLTQASLISIPIPVPPLSEQQRIVSELDLLSGIIEKKKAQLKEYDALAQSIFYDMFGDPMTNEKGWEVKKLGEVCTFSQGVQVDVSEQSTEKIKGWNRFLRIVDYTTKNKDIRYVNICNNRYWIGKDDIAMVRYGSVGVVDIGKEGILANNLFKINYDRNQFNKFFLLHFFRSDFFVSYIMKSAFGATMPALSFKVMGKLIISLPPLPLQQSFASKIEAIERQKSLIQQSITEAETLFNSRMDYWFS